MANAFLDGIGKVLGKVTEWVPGRTQSLKDQEDELVRKLDEIPSQPKTPERDARAIMLSRKLRDVRSKIKNAAGT